MARIRTIKPDFFTHESLSAVSVEAHLLASGLLCYADDEGYFNANPCLVKAAVFPLRETAQPVGELLEILKGIGYITITEHGGKSIGHVVTFLTHQRINRPTPSRLNPHTPVSVDSCSTHTQLSEDSHPEGKGKEGNGIGNDPSLIASLVLGELSLSGSELLRNLKDVCRSELAKFRPADELRAALVTSWLRYQQLATDGKLDGKFTKGAAKFFGEGAWGNEAAWPWKEGAAPQPKRTAKVTEIEPPKLVPPPGMEGHAS